MQHITVGLLRADLGWSLKPVAKKYQNITISLYLFIAILCVKISSVTMT